MANPASFTRFIPTNPNHRRLLVFGAGVMLVLLVSMAASSCSNDEFTTTIKIGDAWHSPAPDVVHTVQSGENLHVIADQFDNVGWEDILLKNERFLQTKYEEVCGKKSDRYRNNARRRGLFCNERYNRPYGNTLMPGWDLVIPPGKAPEAIHQVVLESIPEDANVGLIIDDTGSMANNVRLTGEFYSAALREHGRDRVGIWLYADDEVWKLEDGGFRRSGGRENTHGALKVVADANPDVIILITDEAGDDWNWDKVDELPEVIANCVTDEGRACVSSMSRLATETGGQYVELSGF